MSLFLWGVIGAAIGVNAPQHSVGKPEREKVYLTQEMLVGIADDLIKADIAEVDIDPTVFDLPPQPKKRKKSGLDDIEFVSELEPSLRP